MRVPVPRKVVKHGNERWLLYVPRSFGGGRLYFPTQKEADDRVASFLTFAGRATADFHAHPKSTQVELLQLLDEFGTIEDLRGAARAGKGRAAKKGVKIVDAVQECVAAKKSANVRPYYLYQFENALGRFASEVGVAALDDVTHEHISAWLERTGWSAQTRKNRLTDVQTLYNWAIKRGMIASSPTDAVEKPIVERKPPGILTPRQAQTLMTRCLKLDRRLAPFIAMQLFGGLRPTEARQITLKDITNGHIRIESAASKTRERRLVTINPTIKSWLKIKGDFPPAQWKKRMKLVRGNMPWSHDVLRHSFCSYALPIWGAAKVALEAGHSEQVLFTHYRELVTNTSSTTYFGIRP